MKLISKHFLWPLLIAGLVALSFLPVLHGEFLNWDDHALYVENPYYTGLTHQHWAWMCTSFRYGHWQPLTWLSCALDYKVWELNASGWHLTNLLIHAGNAVLVYLLCLAFMKKPERRYGAAILAALFWAVHPLRVEAVAWLATRGYLLCTTFCLLTVLFYLRSIGQKRYPLTALLFFTLATFTKGIGMMLPLVLLLMDWHRAWGVKRGAWSEGHGARGMGHGGGGIPNNRQRITNNWKLLAEKFPFFALSLVTGLTAFLAKRADGGMVPVEIYGPVQRVGQAIYGIWFYLLKTVSPQKLSPLYEKHPELWQVLVALILSTAALIFFFLFRKRLFAVIGTCGAFLLLIFPMLGITQSGSQMFADRFTYLAAIPFSILLAAGLARLKPLRRTVYSALAALLLIFVIQSAAYSHVWKNGLALWSYAIGVDGSQSGAQNNLAIVLIGLNEYDKALACLDQALAMRPEYADALNNRALIKVNLGEYKEAVSDLNIALSQGLMRMNDRAKMRIIRGLALEELYDNTGAMADYSAVIDTDNADPGTRIKALQARARLYLVAGYTVGLKKDMESILTLPDPSGNFHHRAEAVLKTLNSGNTQP
jgi:hypothetical protein